MFPSIPILPGSCWGRGGGTGPRLLTTALIYKASWREGVSRCEDPGVCVCVCSCALFCVTVRMQGMHTLLSFLVCGIGEKSEAVSKPSQSSDIPGSAESPCPPSPEAPSPCLPRPPMSARLTTKLGPVSRHVPEEHNWIRTLHLLISQLLIKIDMPFDFDRNLFISI